MSDLFSSLMRNRKARLGLVLVGFFVLLALVGPLLVGDPTAFVARPHLPPDGAHWLGTTGQGQDVLAQFVAGSRTTLLVGVSVGLLVTVDNGIASFEGVARGSELDLLLAGVALFLELAEVLDGTSHLFVACLDGVDELLEHGAGGEVSCACNASAE
jgi:ABC-type dipeptide/oligopeptide/nickel transport system permease subunit